MERTGKQIVMAGTVLLLIAAVLLHIQAVWTVILRILHTLRPLLLGVLFATMLEPSYQRLLHDFSRTAARHGKSNPRWIRPVSLIGAVLPPVLVIVSIICVLVPQVMHSVRLISDNISLYSENLRIWTDRLSATRIAELIPPQQAEAALTALQEQIPALLRKTYTGTAALLRVLLDIGIGAVFSLYLLADQQRIRRNLMQLCKNKSYQTQMLAVWRRGRQICAAFALFLGSQCKESLILGGLCWVGMRLFHFPYPVLISAVIGITNIVPYLGPLAGTVPCALLLMVVEPRAVIWFILYIIVLQQLESNLIYPRVVGHSIGLPPAWVLAAIVIGGGLFGMAGLLLSVPIAAVIYAFLFPEEQPMKKK